MTPEERAEHLMRVAAMDEQIRILTSKMSGAPQSERETIAEQYATAQRELAEERIRVFVRWGW